MAADQQFCLRWNNHQSTLISVFDTLLASEQLVDCTLAAEGQYLKAHKVVLSACSPYLELLLAQHYEKHPIVILKDVKFQELKSMMDYMYRGEVNISQDQLATFLKAAESLQIKGLTDSGEDSRDVGSTKRVDGSAQGARKPVTAAAGAAVAGSASARASPAVQGGSGLTIEPRQPASSPHRSRDGSMSPTPRKRRRARRPSQGDAPDSHNDTSNSCDLPPQSAAPLAIAAPDHVETDQLLNNSRLQNSETVLIKEKVEPTSELMIEPKTEYMDENNEDSVEDLTLDDDDDLDMSGRSGMDMGRPGPSHGDSNQGFASWHMQGDRSGTDEVFMAAQEAVGAHRDSQEWNSVLWMEHLNAANNDDELDESSKTFSCTRCKKTFDRPSKLNRHIKHDCGEFACTHCGKIYRQTTSLYKHIKYECGKDPQFRCDQCSYVTKWKERLGVHKLSKHAKFPIV